MARTKDINNTDPKTLTDEHLSALAEGRQQSRVIRDYLEALEQSAPKRGRQRTPESIRRQLDDVNSKMGSASPVQRLTLVQRRIDLEGDLAAQSRQVDMSGLQSEFVKVAKPYSERRSISYRAWREMGVEPAVLKEAGISRSM